ncbi:hypothetical protein PK28_16865 (plasmid) [Hymenobacter sp. DG25B]|uniref:hypothetical protein n=1 Tax=Hymenobacter sp. DG25B TaxID=1385664 RepID=UPI000540879A|nr:hypothetical protein [Hymenobacter sp. DG25B]AIZ65349.1 hypothetical protein PK28_16865 [Hymenobacter sp. DG25B]
MKLTLVLTAALAALALPSTAQSTTPAAPDQISTKKGPLTVQPITHGSVVLPRGLAAGIYVVRAWNSALHLAME